MECEFCNKLKKLKEDEAYYKETNERHKEYEEEYDVALVSNTIYNGENVGRSTYYNFKLNFCPTCGTKL